MRVRVAWLLGLGAVFCGVLSGCATCERSAGRDFIFGRDNFAITNELLWTYEFEADGSVKTRETEPRPQNPHRCFPMARATREVFYHARFEPELPRVDEVRYRELVKGVLGRNSRCATRAEDRVVIPGFANLYEFSAAYPEMIRETCGGSWRSYLQRGNWRMIFPMSGRRERKTARKLVEEIRRGELPIVHLYRFPDLTMNHAVLLFGAREEGSEVLFEAYDPNNPGRPAEMKFVREMDTFLFERNQYFGGGAVKVYEVYRGWFY